MNKLKLFLINVIPSVFAFALTGVYSIVDGYFVGNRVGDNGLTAINLVYPIIALLQAIGTGIGMGGSIHYSIKRAAGSKLIAEKYVQNIFMCLLISSAVIYLLFLPNVNLILEFLGAQGQISELGYIYLYIGILGAPFQIFGTGLVPIIRNNNGSRYAMTVMVAGFLTNVVLDYLLIWVWDTGITGAALATISGQAVTMIGGILYLVRLKLPFYKMRFNGRIISDIFLAGISAFGVTICPNISLLLMNLFLMRYGGNQAVACYAVISYVTWIVYMVLQGVGDGCQPLISDYYGKKDVESLKTIEKLAYISVEIIALVCFGLLFVIRSHLGKFFGSSNEVCNLIEMNMPIILIGFVFLAVSRVAASILNATERCQRASIVTYAEVIALAVLLFVLPKMLGITAVWWSMCLAQILAMLIAIVLRKKE